MHHKKLTALFLAVTLTVALLPTPVFATDNKTVQTPDEKQIEGQVETTHYKDGIYEGTAKGYKSDITVRVTIANGKIAKVEEVTQEETGKYWKEAVALFDQVVAKNSTEVDDISSATYSSRGIKSAINMALQKAEEANTIFAAGDGSESNPYSIRTEKQLEAFALEVDKGRTYKDQFVVLEKDIDLSGIESWNPIGDEGSVKENKNLFEGTFDGKNHTITGLKIRGTYKKETNLGLFSGLTAQAEVKNINLKAVDIDIEAFDGQVRAGAIAGDTVNQQKNATATYDVGSKIDFCSAQGKVKVIQHEAALTWGAGILARAGIATAVTNCWSDVTVQTESLGGNHSAYAGGIVGTTGLQALIVNSCSFADIAASSPKSTNFGGMAGGIVGMLAGKQYNCYALGNVTIGNGGSKHCWGGALDGEITVSGMVKNNGEYLYPDTGELRAFGYYAKDFVLTENIYDADGVNLKESRKVEPLQPVGQTNETSPAYDKVYKPEAKERTEFSTQEFANTLNANISKTEKLLEAAGISDIQLKKWEVKEQRVLLTAEQWRPSQEPVNFFEKGDGTKENPYVIQTLEQFQAFANSVNEDNDYSGKEIVLNADLDISGKNWNPIGGNAYAFNGTFDGKNHTISGLSEGTEKEPLALDGTQAYVGLFGVLDQNAVVKNLNLDKIGIYTTYDMTAHIGTIAAAIQGNRTSKNGAVIDHCNVSGKIVHTGKKGNQFVGGIIGNQYKGAVINCAADVDVSCTAEGEDLAEVGGLVAINNRGLVANSYSLGNIYGSGNRENGKEGMAVVSSLVAVQAGDLVGCYASGNNTAKEFSTYTGMVSGWVTGIGKSYYCWYDLDQTMKVAGKVVKPVESIGTKVASGVNDEGDAYTGGLVDQNKGFTATQKEEVVKELNAKFATYPIDITAYGISTDALSTWMYDATTTQIKLTEQKAQTTYQQPECEKVPVSEKKLLDGIWYGRDTEKTTVVQIKVEKNEIKETKVLVGNADGDAYEAALKKAKEKAEYGDTSNYEAADPSKFNGGDGTKENPYQISNEQQLRYLSDSINQDVDWAGTYFIQTADISLKQGEWKPIGWALQAEIKGIKKTYCAYPFRGNYDGADYSIEHLRIGTKEQPKNAMTVGVFGLTQGEYKTNKKPTGTEQTVTLKNIHVKDIQIFAKTRYEIYAGGVVGDGQEGIYLDNCSATGKIQIETKESFSRAGGISSYVLRGEVKNCWADVDVLAVTDSSSVMAGGMFGNTNRTTILNSFAIGNVTGNAGNNNKLSIGGLTGLAGGIQVNCYAAGNVISLKTTSDVGALNGRSGGIAADVNCYYNKDAIVKEGDTLHTPAEGVGVNANNKALVQIEGKTKKELLSEAFVQQLNANKKQIVQILNTTVQKFLDQSDLVQLNYYNGDGTDLKEWKKWNQYVGLDTKGQEEQEKDCTADYSAVIAALKMIPENLDIYTAESVQKLKDAKNAVKSNLTEKEQKKVDAQAAAIIDAIEHLVLKPVQEQTQDQTQDQKEIKKLEEIIRQQQQEILEAKQQLTQAIEQAKVQQEQAVEQACEELKEAIEQAQQELKKAEEQRKEELTQVIEQAQQELKEADDKRKEELTQVIEQAQQELKKAEEQRKEELAQAIEQAKQAQQKASQEATEKELQELVNAKNELLQLVQNGKIETINAMKEAKEENKKAIEQAKQEQEKQIADAQAQLAELIQKSKEEIAALQAQIGNLEKNDQQQIAELQKTLEQAQKELTETIKEQRYDGKENADYTSVLKALAQIPTDLSSYTKESVEAVEKAKNAIQLGLLKSEQDKVEQQAEAIRQAVSQLTKQEKERKIPEEKPLKVNAIFQKSGIYYKVKKTGKKKEVAFLKAKKQASSVKIPEKVKGSDGVTYTVTEIAKKAFYKNTKIKKVVIPKTVTSIGKHAFYHAKNLSRITINSTQIQKVEKHAFLGIAKKAKWYFSEKLSEKQKEVFQKKVAISNR